MKAHSIQAKSWDEVQAFYANCAASNPFFTPMLELVKQIAGSVYATGLYPATSMHTLLIAQSPTFYFGQDVLRIDLDLNQESFSFLYHRKFFGRDPYEKKVALETAFQALEDFLQKRKWFLLSPRTKEDQAEWERLGGGK
jgi:hypothetical protein